MKNRIDDYNLTNSFSGIYRGIIEDNKDPEKKGRCRVRIFGIHSKNLDKTSGEGIPTDELIWAEPAFPITGGGASGFGQFGIMLQGTQVFIFFEGGNFLQPRFFGWSPTLPETPPSVASNAKNSAVNQRKNAEDLIKSKWEGSIDKIPDDCRPDIPGAVARYFETSCRQPGFISSGKGDNGGASYGIYQFSSKTGGVEDFYKKGMSAEDRKYFDGISNKDWTNPNGECAQAWKKWSEENPDRAFKTQQDYMLADKYPVAAANFKAKTGIDPGSDRALQEMVISTVIQHGTGGQNTVFTAAGLNPSMSKEEMITAVYKDRSNVDVRFKSSSNNVKSGVLQRLGAEEPKIILGLSSEGGGNISADEAVNKLCPTSDELEKKNLEAYSKEGLDSPQPATEGYKDPEGVNPQPNRNDKPNLHQLAQGETNDTGLCHRNKNLDKNIPTVNAQKWEEPEHQAAPEYTKNVVIASAGGVIQEIDTTKGAEGYRVTHPSNSYHEMGANGNILTKANNNSYDLSKVDKNIMVGNNLTLSIINCSYTKIEEDRFIECKNNDINILENNKILVGKKQEETIGEDYILKISGKMDTKINGSNTIDIGSDKTETISGNSNIKVGGNMQINAGIFRVKAGMIYLN